jgi:hypothetical protein
MTSLYKGVIVEESLIDNRAINNFKIIRFRISQAENPADRWHLYTVMITGDELDGLAPNIKPKWYMHFWSGRNVVVIFQGKKFEFDYDDKAACAPAVEYGLAIGIPKEQLDFPID